MVIRKWLQNNPVVVMAIAVMMLVVVTVAAFRTITPGYGRRGEIARRYFYDLSSGEVITMKNQLPPVTTESGSRAVWAEVFSCGSCDDPSQRFVAYLQKASDELLEDMSKPVADQDPDLFRFGMLVALPPEKPGESPRWTPLGAGTNASIRITENHMNKCSDRPTHCQP